MLVCADFLGIMEWRNMYLRRCHMKIKNKILATSFFMMLLSLGALLFIGGFVLHTFAGEFDKARIPDLDPNAFAVEDLIENYDAALADRAQLTDDLSNKSFNLYISKNGEPVFSNLAKYQDNIMVFLESVNWDGAARTFYMNGATITGKKDNGYIIAAVSRGNEKNIIEMQKNQFEVALKTFTVTSLLAIITILITSQFLTNWIVKRIMRPINALTDGANRIVQGNLSEPVLYDGKDELTAVCSTFNQMQKHLQEERDRNASYEKARTDMVAGISHDLRTPLTSVKGYIKGLRDGVANTPEKQDQYLTIAYNKASEMDVLLQKLFYFSKLETGNLPLSLTEEDLGEFVQNFVRHSKEELAQSNVQITTEWKSGANPVQIDTEQMHRVLTNLTENALKYAGAEPLNITITVSNEKDMVHLSFADNGQGVPEEQLENLFVQFWRGDESRSRRDGGGSGLGLNIVKYIVEAHKGTVSARNYHGLVVDLLLPVRKEAKHEQNSDH